MLLLFEVRSESGYGFRFDYSKFDNFIFSLIDQSAKMTQKKPKFGALPKLNMPKKSHESSKPSPRHERSVVKCNEGSLPHSCYKGFSELCQRVKSLKALVIGA